MRRRNDATLIALRQLDRGGQADLTDAERERAEAGFARIVSTPHDGPVTVEPERKHRRWGRVLVTLFLAGAAAVATPMMLTGGTAFGTWSPIPTALTGETSATAADTCRKIHQQSAQGAPIEAPRMGDGGRLIIAERRGGWTFVMIEGPGKDQGICLMPNDDIGKESPSGSAGGYFGPDAADPPTVAPDRIAENISAEGSTDEGWFNWVEGYVGSNVIGVTVHTSSGLDIQASVAGNRFAAWWPGKVQSAENPKGETWTYTVHLANGVSRNAKCSYGQQVVC